MVKAGLIPVSAYAEQLSCCRESRREDVEKIRHLAQAVADRDASILKLQVEFDKMEGKLEQLHREMILREDNYTKTFANGGAGMHVLDIRHASNTQQTAVDSMRKEPPSQSQKNTRKRRDPTGALPFTK